MDKRMITAVSLIATIHPCGCIEHDGVIYTCAAHSEIRVIKEQPVKHESTLPRWMWNRRSVAELLKNE